MFELRFDDLEELRNCIQSDKITVLPLSTQALYLHVLLNGIFDEDDNIINIKTLARAIGASEGDIQLLTDEDYYREIKGENRWSEKKRILPIPAMVTERTV